jgi:hypothetical protein
MGRMLKQLLAVTLIRAGQCILAIARQLVANGQETSRDEQRPAGYAFVYSQCTTVGLPRELEAQSRQVDIYEAACKKAGCESAPSKHEHPRAASFVMWTAQRAMNSAQTSEAVSLQYEAKGATV